MFTLIGLIIAGLFIAAVIALSFAVWRKKVNEKLIAARAKKLVSAKVKALEKDCTNRIERDELNKLVDDGYDYVMATMDSSGDIIGDVELIKDTENDSRVSSMHGAEGVIVVED